MSAGRHIVEKTVKPKLVLLAEESGDPNSPLGKLVAKANSEGVTISLKFGVDVSVRFTLEESQRLRFSLETKYGAREVCKPVERAFVATDNDGVENWLDNEIPNNIAKAYGAFLTENRME